MKKILVTGGTGYIGSHTVVKLIEAGYEVVILDNLSNSKISVIDRIEKITNKRPLFIEGDIRDQSLLNKLFGIIPDISSSNSLLILLPYEL